MKPNIIFVHMLKCGGTSLRYMLLDEYGYEKIAPVPVGEATGQWAYPFFRGTEPLKHQEIIEPEDYQVLMSHYDIRIANRFPEWHIITMLRHPVHQLYSLFKFMQWNTDLRLTHPDMQAMVFKDWLASGKAQSLLNTQTRYLSGHGCENKYTAMSWLLNGRMIFGLLERFEDSVRLFNESFDWSMQAQYLNATPEAPELSDDVIKLAEDLQKDDMELYRIACDLFDSQFKDS